MKTLGLEHLITTKSKDIKMGTYAENEQDAREYAELQRQFAEEKREEEKIVITHDDLTEETPLQLKRAEENAMRHHKGINDWHAFLGQYCNPDGDYERSEEEELLLSEIHQIVDNNILYGSPPYSLESADEILLDIINDLTNMKERRGLDSAKL